jgi:AraC family transcriptional regulator of arabinose operon
VENLAKQVYLHPNYFIVFFKGILGYSPIQYVNQRRMETAKGLLLQPECNVSAVASQVGMQIYYFSRMFKAHTGLTPSHYRKQAATFLTSGNQSLGGEGKQK